MRGGGAFAARCFNEASTQVVSQSIGLEGDSALRSAQHKNHIRGDAAFCSRDRRVTGENIFRPNRRRYGEKSTRWKSFHRLESERRSQNNGWCLFTACEACAALRLYADHVGGNNKSAQNVRCRF